MRKAVYRSIRRRGLGGEPEPDWPMWVRVLWGLAIVAFCVRVAWVVWLS